MTYADSSTHHAYNVIVHKRMWIISSVPFYRYQNMSDITSTLNSALHLFWAEQLIEINRKHTTGLCAWQSS